MAINIRTNLPSLMAQRNVGESGNRLNQSYQRLASGMRINKASDDAAGLAIAENLRADSTIASVAIRNANDAISVIAIADQAIGQVGNVLNRLSELAQQSANGVYDVTQRSALQNEFTALTSEIERIAVTTQFNGLDLLSNGQNLVFQVGFDGSSLSQLAYTALTPPCSRWVWPRWVAQLVRTRFQPQLRLRPRARLVSPLRLLAKHSPQLTEVAVVSERLRVGWRFQSTTFK